MAAADIVAVPVRFATAATWTACRTSRSRPWRRGKPLVASRVGGIPELVRDDENGLLVPEKDAGALADALVTLARDPALRARLGAGGRAEIQAERSWDAVGRRFIEVYERARASSSL